MANWCKGLLKVRGAKQNIVNFVEKELCGVTGILFNRSEVELKIKQDEYSFEIVNYKGKLWFKNLRRAYIEVDSSFDFYEDFYEADSEDENVIVILGEMSSAWDLDREGLKEISEKYGIGFKIFAFERGMEFNVDFEVENGEIKKNKIIEFGNYLWECINPELGG